MTDEAVARAAREAEKDPNLGALSRAIAAVRRAGFVAYLLTEDWGMDYRVAGVAFGPPGLTRERLAEIRSEWEPRAHAAWERAFEGLGSCPTTQEDREGHDRWTATRDERMRPFAEAEGLTLVDHLERRHGFLALDADEVNLP